jgi:hypothetical protein
MSSSWSISSRRISTQFAQLVLQRDGPAGRLPPERLLKELSCSL